MKNSLKKLNIGLLSLACVAVTVVAFAGIAGARDVDPKAKISDDSDMQIQNAVSRELQLNETAPDALLDVAADRGIVTLSGKVATLHERHRAAVIAASVRGVRSVVNLIEINYPTQLSDAALKKNIQTALKNKAVLDSGDFRVTVKKGAVRLYGKAHSWTERDIAERTVMQVAGVRSVQDDVIVAAQMTRSDKVIQEEAKENLRWDEVVDSSHIEVSANQGTLILKGMVGSDAERSRALMIARGPGVKKIVADELVVEPKLYRSHIETDRAFSKTSADVSDAVQAALANDPRVRSFGLRAEEKNGVVNLSGVVSSDEARKAALEDAQATNGVYYTVDSMTVHSPK